MDSFLSLFKMAPPLTNKIKEEIIKLALQGKNCAHISRKIRKNAEIVRLYMKSVKDNGKLLRKKGTGRVPLLKRTDVNLIKRESQKMVLEMPGQFLKLVGALNL